MKFKGEIKFPDLDHPGVPVHFVIEGRQAELIVDGESLGRWSLYDVHARRLVASAFQIDLDGTEVTFIADDPIDFAYRGVEHMAETWAQMKTMQVGRRMVAVRKSRKDTLPSRLGELRTAMEENLEVQARPLAGERVVVEEPVAVQETVPEVVESVIPAEREDLSLAAEWARLEEERRLLAAERARFEEERAAADEREAVRLEAYRLEMQRLEEEREELRRQLTELAERMASLEGVSTLEPAEEVPAALVEEVPAAVVEEAPAAVVEEVPAAVEEEVPLAVEEELPVAAEEPEPAEVAVEPPAAEEEESAEEEPEPVTVGGPVLDLNGLEEGGGEAMIAPTRQPAMAGAGKERGLMGAVRAAFARGGSREHQHQFIEAPGGIGIVRYVCEVCGHVSISVND